MNSRSFEDRRNQQPQLHIGLFNARGYNRRKHYINNFIHQQSLDMLVVVESWLGKEDPIQLNHIINLTKERLGDDVRGRRRHAGVLVLTKNDSRFRVRCEDEESNFAIVEVANHLLAFGYFAPDNTMDDKFSHFISQAATLAAKEHKRITIFGDFNARMEETGDSITSRRGRMCAELMEQNFLETQKPTEGKWTTFALQVQGRSITDLVITNGHNVDSFKVWEDESLGGSDHRPLTFTIPLEKVENAAYSRWNVRKLALPEIREQYSKHLEKTMDDTLVRMKNCATVNQTWNIVRSWFEKATMASCGKFNYSPKPNLKFLTPEIKRKMEELETLLKIYQQSMKNEKNPLSLAAWRLNIKRTQNMLAELVNGRDKELFREEAIKLSDSQSRAALMKIVKCRKSRVSRKKCKLDINCMETHSSYFESTFGGLPAGRVANEFSIQLNEYVPLIISHEEVLNQINRLTLGRAAGPDAILPEMVKYGGSSTVTVLHLLFNKISEHNEIPEDWKKAFIAPIYKGKGNDDDVANYRPISLTCICRRIFERIVLSELLLHVGKLNCIQSGFRQNRQTLHQVYLLKEIVEKNPNTINVFLDFKAAYDLVDRRILWKKLEQKFNCDLSTIQRLRTLFDNNTSHLVVNGVIGPEIRNKRGLIQGSSLSPILFNFFINELLDLLAASPHKIVTNPIRTNFLAFADDVKLHATSTDNMASLLRICEMWSLDVGMQFAPQRCIAIGRFMVKN